MSECQYNHSGSCFAQKNAPLCRYDLNDNCKQYNLPEPPAQSTKEPRKVTQHRMICNRLNATYAAKNHDYGDSFAQLRQRHPAAILTRLYDKYLRLETLLSGEKANVDESIEDTLKDMANYCIMELVERAEEAGKEKE